MHTMPKTLQYAKDGESCRKVTMRNLPSGQHKYVKQQLQLQQVHDFMGSLEYTLPEHGTPGISWIEMFAAFELRGGRVQSEPEAHLKANADTGIREGMKTFQAYVRYIAENCALQGDRHLFHSAKERESGVCGASILSTMCRASGRCQD